MPPSVLRRCSALVATAVVAWYQAGFARPGEDSGASSRTGTPPTAVAHTNAFGLLADSADHPASPPSTKASPAVTQASLAGEEKEA